ncbi:MAG TPA: homoserine kinase [Pseudobdellovibrionaceae bacterium]|jgi:homoserine kinase
MKKVVMKKSVARAFAPATVANVAVGFDILGFALSGLGEVATVRKINLPGQVKVHPVAGFPMLPVNPLKNTCSAGLLQLLKDKDLPFGFEVSLKKSIPIGSGLGGSSLSACASIVAANALLQKKLSKAEVLHYALIGEAVASGAIHADNVGPCLEGGLILVRQHPEISLVKVKTPSSLRCVVILPELSISTQEARSLLTPQVPLKAMIEQTANLAGFLIGCVAKDFKLMGESLRDVVIEPQRAKLIPNFADLQAAALDAGALGCSISGSGPAVFALAKNQTSALKIRRALLAVSAKKKLQLRGSWISPIASQGAHLL